MKVILKTRVQNLGYEWDIVKVKEGYARNFLLPRKLAILATAQMIATAEKRSADRMRKLEETMAGARETAEKLGKVTLTFSKKTRGGKLYGSIGEKDIVEAIAKEHKVEIAKNMVVMKEHLKTIGSHKVTLKLAEGVEVKITVKIEEGK